MNERIEKKLSKRLAGIAPKLFDNVWIDKESNVPCVGGGVDYWGEGQDTYSLWQWLRLNWYWIGDFPEHPKGHEFEHFPDATGFKATTKNLLRLAARCNAMANKAPNRDR